MDMKVELGSGFSLIQNIQKLLTVVGVSKQLVLISCSSNCVELFFFPLLFASTLSDMVTCI